MKKLNLGCGAQVVQGWINVDYAPGAKFAKIPFFRVINRRIKILNLNWDNSIYLHNLMKNFPWKENSIDIIYSSHTLEHFTKEDGLKFLKECYRVLKKDGVIRILVPDLECIINEYNKGIIRSDDFIHSLLVLYDKNSNRIKNKLAPFFQYPHKCMYDAKTLIIILNDLGFSTTSKIGFDSAIPEIEKIELHERTVGAVIVEGFKN